MVGMKKTEIIIAALIVVSFIIAAMLYPSMPDIMASHWGINGRVNGFMPKFEALFLMPFISTVLFAMFLVIPKIDPMRKNIAKFRSYFDTFVLIIMAFLFYVYLLTLAWNMGLMFDIGQALAPAFAALLYYCGILIENAKRNWFMGIRTPWTMSSDKVWENTHKLGGPLFKTCGILSLSGLFCSSCFFLLLLISLISTSIFLVIYSYYEYAKIVKATKRTGKKRKARKKK
jgi:uncharacterized membrane protein